MSSAEHFLYFACIGIFIVVVDALVKVRTLIVRACLVGVLVFFYLTTVEQNIYASSEIAMIKRSLQIQPDNARLQASLALMYVYNESYSQAEVHFRQAVINDPSNPRYGISLGKSICDQGRYEECLKIYESVPNLGSYAQVLNENKMAALRKLSQKP